MFIYSDSLFVKVRIKKKILVRVFVIFMIIVLLLLFFVIRSISKPTCPSNCYDNSICTKDYCSINTSFKCVHDKLPECCDKDVEICPTKTPNSNKVTETDGVIAKKFSDSDCIYQLTLITASVNVAVMAANDIGDDLHSGKISLSELKLKMRDLYKEFYEVWPIIKSKGLDTGCSAEINNNVVKPLISLSNNYASGYKIFAEFSNQEQLQSALSYIENADYEKDKVESYLKQHKLGLGS